MAYTGVILRIFQIPRFFLQQIHHVEKTYFV